MTTQNTGRSGRIGDVAFKAPCAAASTAALTLNGEQTVDGVPLITGQRILVKNQASSIDNGIYVVDTGAWTRAPDFDGAYDVANGTLVKVNAGVANTAVFYAITASDTATVGVDAITFGQMAGPLSTLGALASRDTVATAFIDAQAVTYAKMQQMANAYAILGNPTAALAVPSEWLLDSATLFLNFVGGFSFLRPATMDTVRQTVLSGPVDSSGLASFGGSTGSTTVTMSGDLVVSAAQGFDAWGRNDWIGKGANMSWTGLSTNGTMYLYVDVVPAYTGGTLTAGTGTLQPQYQWGGSYSGTAGQFTFNIQEMIGKVGGAAAKRVYVGEVTVAGGVVTAIIWYQPKGKYESAWVGPNLPSTNVKTSKSHNLGVEPKIVEMVLQNTSTELGFAVGDQLNSSHFLTSDGTMRAMPIAANRLTMFSQTGNTAAFVAVNASGAGAALDITKWKYKMTAERGW